MCILTITVWKQAAFDPFQKEDILQINSCTGVFISPYKSIIFPTASIIDATNWLNLL